MIMTSIKQILDTARAAIDNATTLAELDEAIADSKDQLDVMVASGIISTESADYWLGVPVRWAARKDGTADLQATAAIEMLTKLGFVWTEGKVWAKPRIHFDWVHDLADSQPKNAVYYSPKNDRALVYEAQSHGGTTCTRWDKGCKSGSLNYDVGVIELISMLKGDTVRVEPQEG